MDNRKTIPTSSTITTLNELLYTRPATPPRPSYPTREDRYSQFGWNANSQDCYTPQETTLLQKISKEYRKLSQDQEQPYFSTDRESAWYDLWHCDRPTLDSKAITFTGKSFTLPNRETKDAKSFPLWEFADRMAKQIANWQAERVKKSQPDVMNDPTMLVLEELREWFFYTLTERDGNAGDLPYITQRQSYINNLIHMLPDFGADRLHLHEIQHSLDDARNIVLTSIANKELPQLLSGMIIDAKSLENTIGTYLHYLGINEPVDDNFSMGCLDDSNTICQTSPVRKIYEAAKNTFLSANVNDQIARYQSQHSLYALSSTNENNGIIRVQPALRTDIANNIQFATFLTENDKRNYIESLAILEALTNVRKTLENFRSVQSSIGTYFFAYSYLDKTNELAKNYNALVMKANSLLAKLIHTADDGLRKILADSTQQFKKNNMAFEKNLRALQTKVVHDTTLKNQLDAFCKKSINSMNVYSGKMDELVSDLKSGKASEEVRRAMHELYTQVNDLNSMLTAVLNDEQLMIDLNQPDTCIDMPFSNDCLEEKLIENGETSSGNEAATNPVTLNTGNIVFSADDSFSFEWDKEATSHPLTHIPVYTYRIFKDNTEVGSADYYGQPSLCISQDGTQHNIIKTTGLLNQVPTPPLNTITDVCQAPFPSQLDTAIVAATRSASYGAMSGATTVMGNVMHKRGYSQKVTGYAVQLAHHSMYFASRFYAHYAPTEYQDQTQATLDAMYHATLDTSQMWGVSALCNRVGSYLDAIGTALEEKNWTHTGYGVKKLGALAHYGMFAVAAMTSNPVDVASSLVAGSLAENITTNVGNKLLLG